MTYLNVSIHLTDPNCLSSAWSHEWPFKCHP